VLGPRREMTETDLIRAQRIVELAWCDLPGAHRQLLEAVGADRRAVVDRPLGEHADDLIRSAGYQGLSRAETVDLNRALGVWLHELQLILVDAGHGKYAGLDASSYEAVLAHVAWHEWGHALSIARSTQDDVADGRRLLDLAPAGIARFVRDAGYRPREYTHEVVAEIYAMLMARRRRGQLGKPPWLDDVLYDLVRRVTGWSE
jgi:hypothetical protein